jgi:hypothetical protein
MTFANRFNVQEWTFTTDNGTQLSVVVNLDVLTDKVVASVAGPGHVGLVVGRLQREPYVNGNRGISTRYRVLVNDGTELDWERTRKNALDRAGSLAITRARDAYNALAPRNWF